MRSKYVLLVACSMIFAGCGGGGGDKTNAVGRADVSGVVFDRYGNIVRNAQIFYNDSGPSDFRQTVTNSNGAYVLKDVPALDDLIQCQITSGGVRYTGQNLARLYSGERTMTVNIGLYPQSQLGSIHGTVSDNRGNLLVGAKIFAIPTSGSTITSSYGITDSNGAYFVSGLLAGTAYNIQVNGLGFNSAFDTQTLAAGQDKPLNYSLPTATNTTLSPPTNVNAIAYTAPAQATSQLKYRKALTAIKSIANPGRKLHPMVVTRAPGSGSPIEIDVSWTPISNTSLLGYGIYWATGSKPLTNIDLLRDPQAAAYEDMDLSLTSGQSYTYAVTTVSTSTNSTGGESNLSASTTVTPLAALTLGNVTSSTQPTFHWQTGSGATNYAVMLFDTYPDVDVLDIFDNLASHVTGSSYTYTGAPLSSGKTYYYVVVGFSASGGSQTISQVDQFVVP